MILDFVLMLYSKCTYPNVYLHIQTGSFRFYLHLFETVFLKSKEVEARLE